MVAGREPCGGRARAVAPPGGRVRCRLALRTRGGDGCGSPPCCNWSHGRRWPRVWSHGRRRPRGWSHGRRWPCGWSHGRRWPRGWSHGRRWPRGWSHGRPRGWPRVRLHDALPPTRSLLGRALRAMRSVRALRLCCTRSCATWLTCLARRIRRARMAPRAYPAPCTPQACFTYGATESQLQRRYFELRVVHQRWPLPPLVVGACRVPLDQVSPPLLCA